jgi:ATP-dependent RNA helicase RhlE
MPKQRQTLLFSATMPTEINKLAKEILLDPIRIEVSPKEITVAKIDQRAVMVSMPQKRLVLEHLLRDKALVRAIVFTRTKHGANKVAKQLNGAGFVAEVIHGNKTQAARQRALENFKKGKSWILVATDIAARGIDVSDVSHVINYELPHEPESYVHRIGRTARAGAKGIAWALVDASELSRLRAVERLTKRKVEVIKLDLELPSKTALEQDEAKTKHQGQNPSATASAKDQNQYRKRRKRSARSNESSASLTNSEAKQQQRLKGSASQNRTTSHTGQASRPYGKVTTSADGDGGRTAPRRRRRSG